MNDENEIKLRLVEAKNRDIGRYIVRIDNEIMEKLNIKTGDIIEVIGNRMCPAIVWPGYPENRGEYVIRADQLLRKNIDKHLGENVRIKKADEKIARKVIISPESVNINADPYIENFIRNKLLNYPLVINQILKIPIGINKEVPFQIKSTKPSGVVILKQSTILRVLGISSDGNILEDSIICYKDIGGLNKEIQKIKEVVELPYKHPELFKKLGINPQKGILLIGPPGCGKTLLVKAIANESELYFISVDGTEILSKFYGETEKKIRGIFNEAEKSTPSIIFIDDIDVLAQNREQIYNNYEYGIVSQLLASMDGLLSRSNVIVIGATSKVELLDPAFRRSGRFDLELEIPLPAQNARLEILKIHSRNMPLDPDVNLDEIAEYTDGFSGADLACTCQEAALKKLEKLIPEWDLVQEEISIEDSDKINVKMDDFNFAINLIRKRIEKIQSQESIEKKS